MKKLIFLLILLLTFSYKNLSASEEDIFEWGDFHVIVEYEENLQEVLERIKKGIRLKDGYDDPNFYVENNNVNYTTQSSINTSVLKTYRLDHRACSLKYNKKQVRFYYLHVIDDIPPEIVSSTSFIMAYGSNKPDFLQGIKVRDNESKREEITIIVDDTNVEYQKIGIYPLVYTVIDKSGNSLLHVEYLEIIDVIKPTITKISDLILQVGEQFKLEDYFLIEDNYDTNLNIFYNFTGNLNELGTVTLDISVKDQSGNEEKFNGEIEIKDNIPPTINLKNSVITLNISEKIDLLNLVEVFDNYDELTKEDLIITENIDYDLIGIYDVEYKVKDSSNNETIENLSLIIKDLTPPNIYVEDLKVEKDSFLDFLMYAKVDDNYSSLNNISLKIVYNDVDFTKPGTYYVTYQAVDECGNHKLETITVTVLGATNNQKFFYFLLTGGIVLLITITVVFIIKKNKKTY